MPQGPREPLSAQSGRRCGTGYMEIKGGSGPGWRGACTLAVILLYLHSLLLHTEVTGTTTARPSQPATAGPPLRAEEGEWAGGQEGQGRFPLICPSPPHTAPPPRR